ncbi:putative transmembrane glyco protein [Aspergillus steynii IBT 23096]|uniref:Putative transmembrane glyco protein n=1 Tax=Aspergillus steynii IBT 23096 TaxID=1392250 RepID=A0A2I2FTQ7_9EURO|nr:putative transmembrane glyco protein [Aspergillus steynii IBT 23096]PLB44025.1 putative transmembrane glyco protein [Aspergillus steynii IBT 23096]
MTLWGLVVLSVLLVVDATLVTDYPVNAQLPPVARVLQPFNFTFSRGTFGGVNSNTEYSLSNAPSWLHVDSKNRILSGTPKEEDEGNPKFDLVASDGSDSASMEVTFIVTKDEGPKPGKPLLPQLEGIGATSAPSTILIHSGDSFSITFDSDTFINTRPSTVYYGTSPENVPLPSWIGFDQSNLRFSGVAPNIGPQTFSFNLVASDVAGFGAATASFDMTVSPHILAFKESAQTFFVSRGKEFTSPRFEEILTLDGRQAAPDDLTDITIDSPDWIKLDEKSISLRGTPPTDGSDENVTISVTDKYQDEARLLVSLQYSQFFRAVKDCEAVIGDYFTFVFDNTVLRNDSVQLDVEIGRDLPWLHYNSNNKTLYGQVPSDIDPAKSSVQLTASQGSAKDTRELTIKTVEGDNSHGSSSTDSGGGGGGIHGKKAGIIAIAVIVPFVVVTSLLLLFCCWRRKRRAATPEDGYDSQEKYPPTGPNPSTLPHCQPFEDTNQGSPPRLDRSPSPSSKPPRLELAPMWNTSPFRPGGRKYELPVREDNDANPTIEWDFAPIRNTEPHEDTLNENAPAQPKRLSFQNSPPRRIRTNSTRRREPFKSIQPRRSLKRHSAQSSRSKRYSKRSSGISSIASGLPIRLSGAGHGAGGFGPPGHGVVRVSWQNTHTSLQSDESGVGNLAPLFPRPPPRARESAEYPKRISLRTVEPDNPNAADSDSLEAFVHSRAKHRNSSNPLFSGQLSRRTSSGLRALERARSTASRTDTIGSSNYGEDYRRSIYDRPWSTAMSASVYTDDNRQSAYLESLSEESLNIRPLAPIGKGPSQSSLAQKYSEAITPLPRFFSELSMKSGRRAEPGHPTGAAAHPNPLIEEPQIQTNQPGIPQSNSNLQDELPKKSTNPFRKSLSASSALIDGKGRRASLVRLAERDANSHRGLSRDLNSSVKSDIAFV